MINMFNVAESPFGRLATGEAVTKFTLSNPAGMRVSILDFGGVIQALEVPDREGNLGDVVLGFTDLDPYLEQSPYIGALVGRYGNRIAEGRFELAGQRYQLDINNGPNHLHGGVVGFDKRLWSARTECNEHNATLILTLVSDDGDQGYPGAVSVEVRYILAEDNSLTMDITATTDKTTLLNMTQHSYFNLAGEGGVGAHELQIFADSFTPVNSDLIPTGEIATVAGTPFDFTSPQSITERLNDDHPQLVYGNGYDHNYVLNDCGDGVLGLAAQVRCLESGREMRMHTTEPGVQLYTGNFLDSNLKGKGGPLAPQSGFCLEPQHFPDSPNQPQFPSTVLEPGDTYRTTTVFTFGVSS